MTEIRSAAAMAGCVDENRLIHDYSSALNACNRIETLGEIWKVYVFPVMDQLDTKTLNLLAALHATKANDLGHT